MKNTFLPKFALGLAASSVLLPISAYAQLSLLGGVELTNGDEIVSFDATTNTLAATNSSSGSHFVQLYSLGAGGSLTAGASVNLNGIFGSIDSVTSVLIDSRGFGVASIVPTAQTLTDFGRIAVFNASTGAIINVDGGASFLTVGYHPDSISITPDGSKLFIANEGENLSDATTLRAGSVNLVNLSSVTNVANLSSITQSAVTHHDFTSNLASGVTLAGLRNSRLDTLTVKSPDALDIGNYTAFHKLGTLPRDPWYSTAIP